MNKMAVKNVTINKKMDITLEQKYADTKSDAIELHVF